MVDISSRIDIVVKDYIEPGKYFVINRSRQYGKTTMLGQIYKRLSKSYVVLRLSLEGKEDFFESTQAFFEGVRQIILERLETVYPEYAEFFTEKTPEMLPMRNFELKIKKLCRECTQKVVLIIDEVDKAADYDIFRAFLGNLRDMYIARSEMEYPAIHSVILAGVHDIRNLKKIIRPDEQASFNSPWNIAVPFTVDMSFSAEDIADMLQDYENDNKTGMDIKAAAKKIYSWTSGYPYMVSAICKMNDEGERPWTMPALDDTVRDFIFSENMLFDDLVKNINSNHDFAELLRQILISGLEIKYMPENPAIDIGKIYGIFIRGNKKVEVSNSIFETYITNYFISLTETKAIFNSKYLVDKPRFIENGVLNMRYILQRFNVFLRTEYRKNDETFIEREGRLLFIGFIRGIINGEGNYAVEPETRNAERMDVVVYWHGIEYVIELKIWHGQKRENGAYRQLAGYLKGRSLNQGWLVSFTDNQKLPKENEDHNIDGVAIYEEIVAYKVEKAFVPR